MMSFEPSEPKNGMVSSTLVMVLDEPLEQFSQLDKSGENL